jgi:hypothetical protein
MLAALREGFLTAGHIKHWVSLSRSVVYDDGIEPTQLFPLRAEVEGHNNRRLRELSEDCFNFKAMDQQGYDELHKVMHRGTSH